MNGNFILAITNHTYTIIHTIDLSLEVWDKLFEIEFTDLNYIVFQYKVRSLDKVNSLYQFS